MSDIWIVSKNVIYFLTLLGTASLIKISQSWLTWLSGVETHFYKFNYLKDRMKCFRFLMNNLKK